MGRWVTILLAHFPCAFAPTPFMFLTCLILRLFSCDLYAWHNLNGPVCIYLADSFLSLPSSDEVHTLSCNHDEPHSSNSHLGTGTFCYKKVHDWLSERATAVRNLLESSQAPSPALGAPRRSQIRSKTYCPYKAAESSSYHGRARRALLEQGHRRLDESPS